MSQYHILGLDAHKVIAFCFCVAVLALIIWLVKWLSDQQLDDYQTSLDQANREYANSYHKPRTVAQRQPTQTATEQPSATAPRTADGGQVVHIFKARRHD